MEQVFFRLHVRFVRAFCNVFPKPARLALEVMSFSNAIVSLITLIFLHHMFVGPGQSLNCLSTTLTEAQHSLGRDKMHFDVYEIRLIDGDYDRYWISSEDSSKSNTNNNCGFLSINGTILNNNPNNNNRYNKNQKFEYMNCINPQQDTWDKRFFFSFEMGYLMLPRDERERYKISQLNLDIGRNKCFGSSWGSWIMKNIIGEDTAMINWFLASFNGRGYMYNSFSKELHQLYYGNGGDTHSRDVGKIIKSSAMDKIFLTQIQQRNTNYHDFDAPSPTSWKQRVEFKAGVAARTIFIYFSTTSLISYTLRETQNRMLKFTYLLQDLVRRERPYAGLIARHLLETLVFVPIILGVHFFLADFFLADQLLAFAVLSVVWLAEVYSIICVRAVVSIKYFPQFFCCYFALFHLYFFSFPFGYSSIALVSTVLFIQHTMLYFWNRFEVPALHQGQISAVRPRTFLNAHLYSQQSSESNTWVSPGESRSGARPGTRRRSASDNVTGTTTSADIAMSNSSTNVTAGTTVGSAPRGEGWRQHARRLRQLRETATRGSDSEGHSSYHGDREYMINYSFPNTFYSESSTENFQLLDPDSNRNSTDQLALSRKIQNDEMKKIVELEVRGYEGKSNLSSNVSEISGSNTLSHRYGRRTSLRRNEVNKASPLSVRRRVGSRSDGDDNNKDDDDNNNSSNNISKTSKSLLSPAGKKPPSFTERLNMNSTQRRTNTDHHHNHHNIRNSNSQLSSSTTSRTSSLDNTNQILPIPPELTGSLRPRTAPAAVRSDSNSSADHGYSVPDFSVFGVDLSDDDDATLFGY